MSEIVICIPAWGEAHRASAVIAVIPAIVAALKQVSLSYQFIIYTDDATPFMLLPHVSAEFRPVPSLDIEGKPVATAHDALTAAHLQTLREAPFNSIVGLFNSDIVPSVEVFSLGALALSAGSLAVASFGLRTVASGPPPIGFSAKALLDWGWAHRHPIVDNCIWGHGKTAFPVTLFFVQGRDNVIAHCSHLHPFLVLKQNRGYNFRGTIDDGFLQLYHEREIYYCNDRQASFVEISSPDKPVPAHFMETRDKVLDESFVIEFGKNYLTSHCRSLKQRFRIVGNKEVYDTPAIFVADQIVGNV